MSKIYLFDADGVLTLPEEMFSKIYAASHGIDPEPFEKFFQTEWKDYVTGKKDLKDHIANNPDIWHWHTSPDELLAYWFKTEDVRNDELIDIIREIRASGAKCYLATEQEKYRGAYMKDVMFKDLFDGYFITAELGLKKSNPAFFETVISLLSQEHEALTPADIVFFDDSQSKIDAASRAGIDACLYQGIESVTEKL